MHLFFSQRTGAAARPPMFKYIPSPDRLALLQQRVTASVPDGLGLVAMTTLVPVGPEVPSMCGPNRWPPQSEMNPLTPVSGSTAGLSEGTCPQKDHRVLDVGSQRASVVRERVPSVPNQGIEKPPNTPSAGGSTF